MQRRDFLKGLSAMIAAVPILPAQNIILQDNQVPDLKIPESKKITLELELDQCLSKIPPQEILDSVRPLSLMTNKYGFSYDDIFTKISLAPGTSLTFARLTNQAEPSFFVDKNKQFRHDLYSDYVCPELAEFVSREIPIKRTLDNTNPSVQYIAEWINKILYDLHNNIALTSWGLLKNAALYNNTINTHSFDTIKSIVERTQHKFKLKNKRCTDIYVQTRHFYGLQNYFNNLDPMQEEPTPCYCYLPPITVYGVNIKHGPELAWWPEYYGLAVDNSNDQFIHAAYDYPIMFTNDHQRPYNEVVGQACHSLAMYIPNADCVRLIK